MRRGERGQMLIMFVGIVTVFFVIAAIVVDFGLWLAERREVQRVADLAAAAGAQDLPVDDSSAVGDALVWAGKNGYSDGVDGVDLQVDLLCKNSFSHQPAGVCTNTSPPGAGSCTAGNGCDSLRVTIARPASILFSGLFGIGDIEVSSQAAAGMRWGEVAIDSVVLLDATDGMAGAGSAEAKAAANGFADMLFDQGSPNIQVGYAAYNYCYTPDWTPPAPRPNDCVPRQSALTDLTTSSSLVHRAIDLTSAAGDTNVCLPLFEARRMLFGMSAQAGGNVRRAIVMLTDGDNNFTYGGSPYPRLVPPPSCRPSTASATSSCPDQLPPAGERDLDMKTNQQANALKHPPGTQRPVEIYVVGFHVCGVDDGNTQAAAGYCTGIGDVQADSVADQRLLKCVASSPDHYFHVDYASDLPDTFREIAARIVGRRLLQ